MPVELLSDTYRTALSKLLFKDKNGHRFEISWVGLSKNRYLMCEKCMLVQKGKDERVPKEIIKSLFEENGIFIFPPLNNNLDKAVRYVSDNNSTGKSFLVIYSLMLSIEKILVGDTI